MKKLTISPKTKEKAMKIRKVAENSGEAIADFSKKFGKFIGETGHDVINKANKSLLNPIFESEMVEMPDCFSTFDIDKRRKNAEVCNGSIGHTEKSISNFYPKNIAKLKEKFSFSFSSVFSKGMIYLINPYNNRQYIDVNEYFKYLQKCFVEELDYVGHCLGAKHVNIRRIEMKKTFISVKKKAKINAKLTSKAQASMDFDETALDESTSKILKDSRYKGGKPEEPKLKYLKGEPDIENLINQRLSGKNGVKFKEYVIKMGSHIKLQKKLVADIDYIAKQQGACGNCELKSEVETQNRLLISYIYEF